MKHSGLFDEWLAFARPKSPPKSRHFCYPNDDPKQTAARDAAVVLADSCSAGAMGHIILPVDVAVARAVAIATPVHESERVPLSQASGRVLGCDVTAEIDLPPFSNSAMDGYAVRLADFHGSGPWSLSCKGRITAGESPISPAGAKLAVRIFTGAPVPEGFDAVLMQEHCEREGDRVVVKRPPRQGENVRLAGEDVRAGTRILQKGRLLAPQQLGLLAAQGLAEVEVVRKVRVGLVSTGSELRDPGQPLGRGQIYNSNRIAIRSMVASFSWADVVDYGIVPDRPEALAETFSQALRQCDVLVTTGGVSEGEGDYVLAALEQYGGTPEVLKVAMRPGKPVKVGMIGATLFAGLPGNPSAAFVTFRQIALPAIRAVAGLRHVEPRWLPAVAGFCYAKRVGRTEFVPVKMTARDPFGIPVVEMLGRGSSASLSAMAYADGIAMLPPESSTIEIGQPLRVEPICGF